MNQGRLLLLAVLAALTAFFALPAGSALAATYTVDTTSNASLTACTGAAGDCSLRGAMTNANASGAGDFIQFDAGVFPVGAPATITLGSALPTLTGGNEIIDATGRGVIIKGAEARTFHCIVINSAGNQIRGGLQLTDCNEAISFLTTAADNNTIRDNTMFDNDEGIHIGEGDNNQVLGNKIGTNPLGTAIPPEGGNAFGVLIGPAAANNVVGSTVPSLRNIISGNTDGVFLQSQSGGNTIAGNFIGTDVTGIVDLGNLNGVNITLFAAGNTVGGTLPGFGNLISGNTNNNVIVQFSAVNNVVSGNIIGPNINGSGAAMTNGGGVTITGASFNTIGPGNVISDNGLGVFITGSGTQSNVVKGNLIGTNLSGTAAVPNDSAVRVTVSARFNTIGGPIPGDGNVIAFSTAGRGVEVNGSATTNNSIRANSIHDNFGIEIDNAAGGNLELAPPALTSSNGLTVTGTACPFCAVDIFSDAVSDPRIYEGSATAGAGGNFTFTAPGALVGPNLVATQTDIFGNTSEVSGFIAVVDNDGDGLGDAADPDDDNDGLPDTNDLCPKAAEDFDGFQDADGCPEPDNDLDGVCDPGQASPSCTGSDSGKTCFDPAGTLSCPTIDCRNLAEDYDAFKDSDGCPEPDNDNDGFPDSTDQCPGTSSLAGADGVLGSPQDLNHNGIQDGAESALTSDDSTLSFEDYDGTLDTDGCHDSPGDDTDGDSFGRLRAGLPLFSDEREFALGTNPGRACAATATLNDEPMDPQPEDFDDDGFSDVSDLVAIAGLFGDAQTPSNIRFDLNLDGFIDIVDIVIVAGVFGQRCVPPGPLG